MKPYQKYPRDVPRFFKSALFPLVLIVIVVYVASQLIRP
jgi:hypothetical protein